MGADEGAVEDGASAGDAGDIFHGLVFEISRPDANGEFRGVADAPVIAKIRGGAGFHGAAEGQIEGAADGERWCASGFVREDVGDEPGGGGVDEGFSRGRFLVGEEAGGEEVPHASEGGVGVGEFEESDWGIAEGEAEAVGAGWLGEGSDARFLEEIAEFSGAAEGIEFAQSRNVEGAGECLADGNGTAVSAVVIFREL